MPGLPDYIALNDCAEIFANSETFRKGRLLDYPADWGTTNVDRIAALGLNFTSVPGGCGGAMVAEMKAAEAPDEPLLVMFWSPHLIAALVDLHPVSLPAYEEGCQDDPSVGVNPNAAWSRSQRVSNFLRPVNDTLQSTPLFVILIPFLIFFFSKRGIHFLSGNHRLRHRPDHSLYRAWFAQRAERNRGGGEVHGQHPPAIAVGGENAPGDPGNYARAVGLYRPQQGGCGLGLVAGLGIARIALIAIIADRIIQSWCIKRKEALGIH